MNLSRQAMLKQMDDLKACWVAFRKRDFDTFFKHYSDLTQALDEIFEFLRTETDGGKEKPKSKGSTKVSIDG